MIDTHAHLDFKDFDEDREEVITRFFGQGGRAIINIGVDLETSKKSIKLAEKYEGIFASVGFHPHDAEELLNSASEDNFIELKKLAKHKKVVAIGEIGLDYSRFREAHQIEEQKKLFAKQLGIAKELRLPVIVHCREAWEDVYGFVTQSSKLKAQNHNLKLKAKNINFILHCYSGSRKDTEKFLKLPNAYFSFSGNITYPKPVERAEELAEAVRMIPLDKIMLDSDSPFLSPQAMRGKRNEPLYIKYIAEKVAQIKGISVETVLRKTTENARGFFLQGENI